METIFTFIEETDRKLNRRIEDLDDIRTAMSALKDIRELQISIDSQVGPIEVVKKNVAFLGNVSAQYLFSALVLSAHWKHMISGALMLGCRLAISVEYCSLAKCRIN